MAITLPPVLQEMESAEDFLRFFDVAYDQKVVHVARLHILQRFHDYLQKEDAIDGDEAAQFSKIRELLLRAYDDFVRSDPMTEGIFKVHKEARLRAQLGEKAFVPLADVVAGVPKTSKVASGESEGANSAKE